ncbi:MAG: LysR substrate-binding domain-containing protein [Pseudomonadota bacterium]
MKFETIDKMELRSLVCFERVARLGSFSAAGRQLDLPRAAVSRIIGQLEGAVGTALFQRTTRRVSLTQEGAVLLERAAFPLTELRSALLETASAPGKQKGSVRFSVSRAFGQHFILPALPAFSAVQPEIRVDVTLSDDISDIVQQGLDFAIRLGELPDSSLIARKLAEIELVLALPRSLVDIHGLPKEVSDLHTWPAIGFRIPGTGRLYHWTFNKRGQVQTYLPQEPRITVDSIEDAAGLVREGAGIALLPRYLVESELADGRLVTGLPDHGLPTLPIHLCFPAAGKRPERVEALARHITGSLRGTQDA